MSAIVFVYCCRFFVVRRTRMGRRFLLPSIVTWQSMLAYLQQGWLLILILKRLNALCVTLSSIRHALEMNFKPVSRKISKSLLGITLEAEFQKEGKDTWVMWMSFFYPLLFHSYIYYILYMHTLSPFYLNFSPSFFPPYSDDDMQSTFSSVDPSQSVMYADDEDVDDEELDEAATLGMR